MKRNWEQKPLLMARNDRASFQLISASRELEAIIQAACQFCHGAIELLDADATRWQAAPNLTRSAVRDGHSSGKTIRVNNVQRFSRSIGAVVHELEEELQCPIKVNLYNTPPHSVALPRHHDLHSVLVTQLSGEKHWRVYSEPVHQPIGYVAPLRVETAEDAKRYRLSDPSKPRSHRARRRQLISAVMRRGDAIYIPRGFLHNAWTRDSPSVHLTFGFQTFTVLDLFTVALADAAQRCPILRTSLPPSFATDLSDRRLRLLGTRALRSIGDKLAFERAAKELAEAFERGRLKGY